MTAYTVRNVKHASLAANVADTITLTSRNTDVEVLNRGSSELYFTADGSAVSVGGDNCYIVLAGGSLRVSPTAVVGSTLTVRLIASAATAYSVTC